MTTTELLYDIMSERGCFCEDCKGYAWDRVIEIEGSN